MIDVFLEIIYIKMVFQYLNNLICFLKKFIKICIKSGFMNEMKDVSRITILLIKCFLKKTMSWPSLSLSFNTFFQSVASKEKLGQKQSIQSRVYIL